MTLTHLTRADIVRFNRKHSVAREHDFEYIDNKRETLYLTFVTFRTLKLGPFYAILLTFLFSSCAVYDFFSQRYVNATAYFNTYYNAERVFDEAEAEVQAQRLAARVADETDPVQLSSQTKQKFNQVIEKCSKLLQFYPKSKWVDDALFLIGASYYYLGDDQKAQRKFTELLSTFPKSGLVFKSNIWLAKSLYRMRSYPEAAQILEDLIQSALEEKSEEIAIEGMFLLGRTFSDQKAYAQSIQVYRRIIGATDDDRARSRAQVIIGYLFAEQDSLQNASEAYGAVSQFDPDENSRVEAGYQRAVILNRIGKHEEALETLIRLRKEIRDSDLYPRVDLELANTYNNMNLLDNAIDQYRFVDTTYARTEVSAKGYFSLGQLYEKKLIDYYKAMASYDKARNEFPKSDVTNLALSKWNSFQNYFRYHKTIAQVDSLLAHQMNLFPVNVSADSNVVLSDSLVSDTARAFSTALDTSIHAESDSSRQVLHQSYMTKLAEAMYGLGNLFLLEINLPDSAEYWYRRVIVEHPTSSVAPRALYTLAELYRSSEQKNRESVDQLYWSLIEKYPDTQYAEEAKRFLGMKVERKADPAAASYARGEALLLEGKNEPAVSAFRSLIRDYPDSPSVPKTKYALGWIFENVIVNPDSAADYYRQVCEEFPNCAYAEAVKAKLLALDTLNKDSESDSESASPKLPSDEKVIESEKSKKSTEDDKLPP